MSKPDTPAMPQTQSYVLALIPGWPIPRVARVLHRDDDRLAVEFCDSRAPSHMTVHASTATHIPASLAERLLAPISQPPAATRRPTSTGAEAWLGMRIPVLDAGWVCLLDYAGTDEGIAEAARTSYGERASSATDNRKLIRFLRRHGHTGPFEMVETRWHVRLPIFVARQWVRHRTASLNEQSGRYSVLTDDAYVPPAPTIASQVAVKQGRDAPLPPTVQSEAAALIARAATDAHQAYQRLLSLGVARETARLVLPVNTYTQWVWKIDLHNLFHFLRLRLASDAQAEIRAYAGAVAQIVRCAWPVAWEAFDDYVQGAVSLAAPEVGCLQRAPIRLEEARQEALRQSADLMGPRERAEFLGKLVRLGMLDVANVEAPP